MKKLLPLVLLFCFTAVLYAQTTVTNTAQLNAAISSPTVTNIVFGNSIDLTANIAGLPVGSTKTIDGNFNALNGSGTRTGFVIASTATSFTIENLTITSMSATGTNSSALRVTAGNFTANGQVDFIGNKRTLDGGAIVLSGTTANAVFNGTHAFERNSAGSGGGALFAGNGSSAIFNGSASFTENTASTTGGAVYANSGSSVKFLNQATFEGNAAVSNGGAVSMGSGASLLFVEKALFDNNRAAAGGALYLTSQLAASTTTAVFSSSAVFTGNKASGNGGAISANSGANVSFSGQTDFTGNSGNSAGAVYLANVNTLAAFSMTTFTNNAAVGSNGQGGAMWLTANARGVFNGAATFEGNTAVVNGGAIAMGSGSSLLFNEVVIFENNRAATGGALYLTAQAFPVATSVVFNSDAQFINNAAASGNGGAIVLMDVSTATFNATASFSNNVTGGSGGALVLFSTGMAILHGDADFLGNRAVNGSGGAVYLGLNSSFVMSSTAAPVSALFSGNSAGQNGGAFFSATGGTILLDNANFIDNSVSAGSGGAVYLREKSSFVMTSTATALFSGNTAASAGGALAITGGSVVSLINKSFINNSAATGGAIYLKGADAANMSVFSSTVTSGTMLFQNNSASAGSGLYLDDDSAAYFYTASTNTSVEMHDNIDGSKHNTKLTYAGTGDFKMYGSIENVDLDIKAAGGASFHLMANAAMNAGIVHNFTDSILNMDNGTSLTVYADEFINDGTLRMNIFQNETNDKMIVSGGLILDNVTSKLELESAVTDLNFKKKIYTLINYDSLSGTFAAFDFNSAVAFTTAPALNYGAVFDNWITLTLIGSGIQTNFSSLSPLTFNQRETAKAFDKLSRTSTGDLDNVIALIAGGGEQDQKDALSQASGYFLANVIRNAAADSPNNEIYDRIKNHCPDQSTSNGAWVQAKGGKETFKGNNNSLGDYTDNSAGVMAGFDRYMSEIDLMLGIYARFSNEDIEQGNNKADGQKNGAGIYAGYIKEMWELKAFLLGSYDSFDTERYIPFVDRTAKADIKAATLNTDLEGALKFDIAKYFKLRPYLGVELENTSYDGFKEKGADSLNLDVDSGNYLRTSGRAGAGVLFEKNIWSAYVNVECKYLISGEEPEITAVFEGTSADFRSRGAKEGRTEFGSGIGGAVSVYKGLKIFVNGNYYAAQDYSNIYGNAGIRYTFCGIGKKEKEAYQKASEEETEKLTEEQQAQYQRRLEESRAKQAEEEQEARMAAEAAERRQAAINADNEAAMIQAREEAKKRREKPVLKSFSMDMASFAAGSSNLTKKSKENISLQASEVKQFEYKHITIEGHTDSTGSGALNKRLSTERAKAVYDEFIANGIPAEKMSYIGFSSSMPKADNKTADGRAKNRRVEIFVE